MDLQEAASELLQPLGFEVLELTISGRGSKRLVLLRIDRLDGQQVSIEDVSLASEVFGLELDRLDPFAEPYRLEVESPGPQRPLLNAGHFRRFHDLLAKVETSAETFRGTIREVAEDGITFEVEGELRRVALKDIERATLAEWPKTPR